MRRERVAELLFLVRTVLPSVRFVDRRHAEPNQAAKTGPVAIGKFIKRDGALTCDIGNVCNPIHGGVRGER